MANSDTTTTVPAGQVFGFIPSRYVGVTAEVAIKQGSFIGFQPPGSDEVTFTQRAYSMQVTGETRTVVQPGEQFAVEFYGSRAQRPGENWEVIVFPNKGIRKRNKRKRKHNRNRGPQNGTKERHRHF